MFEVPGPNSKRANNFIRDFLQVLYSNVMYMYNVIVKIFSICLLFKWKLFIIYLYVLGFVGLYIPTILEEQRQSKEDQNGWH